MKNDKYINELAKDMFKFMGYYKEKPKRKRFIPKYQYTTHKDKTIKWYKQTDGDIKIVNGGSYDWGVLKDDFNTQEDFIKSYIEVCIEKEEN